MVGGPGHGPLGLGLRDGDLRGLPGGFRPVSRTVGAQRVLFRLGFGERGGETLGIGHRVVDFGLHLPQALLGALGFEFGSPPRRDQIVDPRGQAGDLGRRIFVGALQPLALAVQLFDLN